MDLTNFATCIPVIIMCYLIGVALKAYDKLDNKYIPAILGVAGGLLGSIAYFVIPTYPADDIFTGIAVGIMSGFASTAVNQIYKQFKDN